MSLQASHQNTDKTPKPASLLHKDPDITGGSSSNSSSSESPRLHDNGGNLQATPVSCGGTWFQLEKLATVIKPHFIISQIFFSSIAVFWGIIL